MSDEELLKIAPRTLVEYSFNGYTYNPDDYYELMAQALLKVQAGYYNCHSLMDVLTKADLISVRHNITAKGRRYLFEYFYNRQMAV